MDVHVDVGSASIWLARFGAGRVSLRCDGRRVAVDARADALSAPGSEVYERAAGPMVIIGVGDRHAGR